LNSRKYIYIIPINGVTIPPNKNIDINNDDTTQNHKYLYANTPGFKNIKTDPNELFKLPNIEVITPVSALTTDPIIIKSYFI